MPTTKKFKCEICNPYGCTLIVKGAPIPNPKFCPFAPLQKNNGKTAEWEKRKRK